jgi:hypothetical protein
MESIGADRFNAPTAYGAPGHAIGSQITSFAYIGGADRNTLGTVKK